MKLNVDQILSAIEELSSYEKEDLIAQLPKILNNTSPTSSFQSGQFMENTLGDVNLSGGNTAFNYQPNQAGGDVNLSANFNQGSAEQRELFQALTELKQALQSTESLPELSKIGAAAQVEQLAAEAQKDNPDKNLIDRTVSALKQGLQGVQDLAGPVMSVASIVAKAWGIPV
jgi:hypothetical protein